MLDPGSVRAIVNASGAVTERNDYHPYGARHSNSSLTKTSGNRWRFSGKEELGARFYDRTAWSSLDPLAEKYYSLSPYAFCAGNPIIFVDRDGRDIWTINKDGYIEMINSLLLASIHIQISTLSHLMNYILWATIILKRAILQNTITYIFQTLIDYIISITTDHT